MQKLINAERARYESLASHGGHAIQRATQPATQPNVIFVQQPDGGSNGAGRAGGGVVEYILLLFITVGPMKIA